MFDNRSSMLALVTISTVLLRRFLPPRSAMRGFGGGGFGGGHSFGGHGVVGPGFSRGASDPHYVHPVGPGHLVCLEYKLLGWGRQCVQWKWVSSS
jgi:hypothetical protein